MLVVLVGLVGLVGLSRLIALRLSSVLRSPLSLGSEGDLTDRLAGATGGRGHIVVLGLDPGGRDLDPDQLPVDPHRVQVPRRRPPFGLGHPYTERPRRFPDDGPQMGHRRLVGKHVHHGTRATLLHDDRRQPGIVGARLDQGADGMRQLLPGGVIDVGFQQGNGLAGISLAGRRLPLSPVR